MGVIPPLTLSYVRWFLSVLIFLPFCWREVKENAATIKANWFPLMFLGAIGYIGFTDFQYLSVKYTTAINANIINASTPVFTALGAYFIYKNRLRGSQVLGIILSFFGVAWLITRGNLEYLLDMSINIGDLFMLAAVLVNTAYILTLRLKGKIIPPNSLYISCVVGGLIATIPVPLIEIYQVGWEWASQLTELHFLSLLYFAVFPSILSMLFFNRAIINLGPVETSIYTNLGIVFTSIMGIAILKENVYMSHILGGCLIILGVWLTNRQPAVEAKPSQKTVNPASFSRQDKP